MAKHDNEATGPRRDRPQPQPQPELDEAVERMEGFDVTEPTETADGEPVHNSGGDGPGRGAD